MYNDIKNVGIYTRVSTIEQVNEGYSLEEQQLRLTKYCESQGYKIYKIYTDAGISGKATDNRPGYQEMMRDMRKGKVNLILAFKMDRISRSIIDLENFFNTTKKFNCSIEFLYEKFDTNGAAGMLFARMLGIFAMFERELIQERTLIGVEGAINNGNFGGKTPFGYKKEVINGEKTKKLVIKEEEAVVVKEIFNLCLKGHTYTQIAKCISENYPNITYIQKNNKTGEEEIKTRVWKDGTICKILNNKIYYGVWEHHKNVKDKKTIEIKGKIPPIVTEDIFLECQDNIQKNSRNYYRNKRYLFMQKIVCPKCGRVLACNGTKKKTGQTYLYYKCKDCKVYFREDKLEEALVKRLSELLELYMILEKDYIAIDNELAKDLNSGKIDHTIRYSLDSILIDKKRSNAPLTYIWDKTDYEVKCSFINEYIDNIKVKARKRGNEAFIEIVDLNLKKYKINQLFKMKEKNILDERKLDSSCNYSTFKNEAEVNRYVELLKKKYNIDIVDISDYINAFKEAVKKKDYAKVAEIIKNRDFNFDKNTFRVIDVKNNNVVEKDKTFILKLI